MKDRFKELASIWLNKAQDDFSWAKDTMEDGRFGGVCFLCQQAVEKALKAYLFNQKEKLIRTHNLPMLNEKCKKHDSSFSMLHKAVDILNQYYTDTRYPDIWDCSRFEDKDLAKEALKLTKETVEFIKKKLKT